MTLPKRFPLSLLLLAVSSIFIGSCACDCEAQVLRGGRNSYGQNYGQGYSQGYGQAVGGTYQVQPAPRFDPNKKVTGAEQGMYRHGQTIDFPTGPNRLQLTVLVSRNFRSDPNQMKMALWFTGGAPAKDKSFRSANPRLRAIQDAVAFRYQFTDDPNHLETARGDVMGTAPSIWLTGPDGRIARDGGAGCHLDLNHIASLSGPDEVADLIIAAAEGFNPKPQIMGLMNNPIEAVAKMAGTCSTCGIYSGGGPCPNCNPAPQPNSNPAPNGTVPAKVPPMVPKKKSVYSGVAIAAMSFVGLCAAILVIGYVKPFQTRAT
jgi:hypothetical protein